ncbi:UNVERIFIED_CONTAM: hypothetical protein Sangu_2469200 [Sesamum angustifolium]|uniref:Uncharacterized protein n=1 Tax=Sesamum angustifolium TaxID=2727405 RepID=A0AAW2IXJ5_9LAMI
MSISALPPYGRGHRGQRRGRGRGRGPPQVEPADPEPDIPSSEAVSHPPSIPTDSSAVGLATAGATNLQVSARPWDASPLAPVPLLPS